MRQNESGWFDDDACDDAVQGADFDAEADRASVGIPSVAEDDGGVFGLGERSSGVVHELDFTVDVSLVQPGADMVEGRQRGQIGALPSQGHDDEEYDGKKAEQQQFQGPFLVGRRVVTGLLA